MKKLFLIFPLIALLSCGGSSGSDGSFRNSSGIWEVTLNLVTDQCELIIGGGDGLVIDDVHAINQMGATVELESDFLFFGYYEGTYRSADSFVVNTESLGEPFAPGVTCDIIEDIAYNNITGDSADVFVSTKISCTDGQRCDSAMRGKAVPAA